jgi:hypothetical protein
MLEKSKIKNNIRTGFMGGVVGTPAESPAEKVQDARDNLKDARENLLKAREAVVQALKDSVQNFKKESQEKNSQNEKIIAQFREMIPAARNELIEKYYSRIEALDHKNSEMKRKLDEYRVEGKGKWVSFKHEFNHDMNGLEKALKEFTIEH